MTQQEYIERRDEIFEVFGFGVPVKNFDVVMAKQTIDQLVLDILSEVHSQANAAVREDHTIRSAEEIRGYHYSFGLLKARETVEGDK